MTAPALRLEGIEKRYGRIRALAGIWLEVQAGETVALTGANGSGKTTLLRVVAGLMAPDRGAVIWETHPRPPGLGLVGHQTMLYGDLTAWENLRFFARLHGLAVARAEVERWLEEAGLGGRADDLVRTFSRGMRQRLAIVRALITRPEVLLLDEPGVGLDASGRQWLQRILQEQQQKGTTILFATHEDWLLEAAGREVHMAGGRIEQQRLLPASPRIASIR
jgi:heme exporter protein A